MRDGWLPAAAYDAFVSAMPLVCVEVFLEHDGTVLVAKRANEPARGEWFWPGGRLYKGERLVDAAHRVAGEELGVEVELLGRLGVYEHFWGVDDGTEEPDRHTVNVTFRARPAAEPFEITLDDQHTTYRFVDAVEPDLHEYVRRYLADSGLFDR